MPRWWTAAATRAAAGLSVRYREAIGLVAGLVSMRSRSEASVEIGHRAMSTACFEAPTLPSMRSRGVDRHKRDAEIHLHEASHHSGPSFPR